MDELNLALKELLVELKCLRAEQTETNVNLLKILVTLQK
jgi:hypothetical protein